MENGRSNLKEIARLAGVSIGTVHRAIYGKPGVGEKTRREILRIVDEVGYRINEAASIMKRGDLTVCVVLPAPVREDRYYFRGIWAGVRDAALKRDRYKIHFTMVESKHRLDKIHLAMSELYDSEVENIHGLITIADTPEADAWVSRFSKRGVPVILLSSCEQDAECVASIKVDHRVCGELAADFFAYALPRRKSRVLFLSGQADSYSNLIYAEGFGQRMREHFPACDLIRVEGLGRSSLAARCREIALKEKLDGVFALNARNTVMMCELLAELPNGRELLFVGSDVFDELGPAFDSGIIDASVYQFHREQGERAVNLMFEHLLGNPIPDAAGVMPTLLALRSNYRFFSS